MNRHLAVSTITAIVGLLCACSAPRLPRNASGSVTASIPGDDDSKPTGPAKLYDWRVARMRDETGAIPVGALATARSQRAAMLPQSLAGISRFGWVSKGPAGIGGRTRSLVINPSNTNELWAGSVGGGVWHSLDAGLSWQPQNDFMGNIAIGCMAMVPGSSSELYAGTGEGFYNYDAIRGAGIYRTSNGGATWSLLPATAAFGSCNRLAVSTSGVVLAATTTGIYRSTNSGSTWTLVRAVANNAYQVIFDPNNANKCIASVNDASFNEVLVSSNAGQTWASATSGIATGTLNYLNRVEVAFAKSVPNRLLAFVGAYIGGAPAAGQIWRSDNGGATWSQLSGNGLGNSVQMWYDNAIWVDPVNANVILCGAQDLFRSFDGGTTFTSVANGYISTQAPHPDIHGFISAPNYNGSTVRSGYVVSDGGIHYTNDIYVASPTGGWSARNSGYVTTQFLGAAGHLAADRICGGTQDNGHWTVAGPGSSPILTAGGDGGFAAMDPNNGLIQYGEFPNLGIYRSLDGGVTTVSIAPGATNSLFIAPFALDPNTATTMYAGGAALFRSTNVTSPSPTWSNVKGAIGTGGSILVSAICVAPGNPAIALVGYSNGRVSRSANATAGSPTWTALDNNGAIDPLPDRFVTRMLIDWSASNSLWVCLGGYASPNLWLSTDGGATWSPRAGSGTGTLPSAPIYGICQHPTQPTHLYLATEVGVFATDNYGLTWSADGDGPADVSVNEIVFMAGSSRLLAATHGRGLWVSDVIEPGVTTIGAGCPAAVGIPALNATPPRLGTQCVFTGSNIASGSLTAVVLGLSSTVWNGLPLPINLSSLGLTGCTAYTSLDLMMPPAIASPTATSTLPIPASSAIAGLSLFAVTFVVDASANPFGAALSNTLALTIGN